jgi:parvulin-like peptidyl-prolyl isomerase
MLRRMVQWLKNIQPLLIGITCGVVIYSAIFMTMSNILHPHTDDNNVEVYKAIIDSLDKQIAIKDDSIASLNVDQVEIINHYEGILQEYANPTNVSDDSITRYITRRIAAKKAELRRIH